MQRNIYNKYHAQVQALSSTSVARASKMRVLSLVILASAVIVSEGKASGMSKLQQEGAINGINLRERPAKHAAKHRSLAEQMDPTTLTLRIKAFAPHRAV